MKLELLTWTDQLQQWTPDSWTRNAPYMKMVMFSFYWICLREVLIYLKGNFRGCNSCCCCVLGYNKRSIEFMWQSTKSANRLADSEHSEPFFQLNLCRLLFPETLVRLKWCFQTRETSNKRRGWPPIENMSFSSESVHQNKSIMQGLTPQEKGKWQCWTFFPLFID